jgi:uncharacterized membrane protein YiaA
MDDQMNRVATGDRGNGAAMSVVEWILWIVLASIYLVALFTVCVITFRKGYVVLGVLGIFLPFLWLIGAILPDRRARV